MPHTTCTLDDYVHIHNLHCFLPAEVQPFMRLAHFAKGEALCRQEQPLPNFLLCVQGKVKIYSSVTSGRGLLHRISTEFEFLGDVEAALQTEIATTTVEALSPVVCITLPYSACSAILRASNSFLQYISQSLAMKLTRNSMNSSINLLYPVENRLAAYILQAHDGGSFHENYTLLAELLGCSYRQLMRALDDFCTRGFLCRQAKGRYYVQSPAGLAPLGQDIYQL